MVRLNGSISPPYVSQLIRDLETRLGRQLLYRSTRQIALSSDGEQFLPIAQQIAWALDEGLNTFRNGIDQLSGNLRLSIPTIMATPFFARVVASFQQRHTAVALDIKMDDQLADTISDQIDLTIRIGDPGPDLRPAELLMTIKGLICAAPQRIQSLKSPDDLIELRWSEHPPCKNP